MRQGRQAGRGHGRLVAVVGMVASLAALVATGCGDEETPRGTQAVARSTEVGDCLGRDPRQAGGYTPRGCDDAEATHEIVAMVTDLGRADRPLCPPGTDEPVAARQGSVVDGDIAALPQTWCLRSLEPPHPGDPGMGGGEVVEQDCVVEGPDGTIDEVPCDGQGPAPPQHRVVGIVDVAEACPPGTAQPIELDTTRPRVLCAGPV